MDVAEAAFAATGNQHFLAVGVEIGNDGLGVLVGNDGADRDVQGDVVAALAVAVAGAAVLASAGEEFAGVAVFDQRIEVAIGDDIDAAAATTVAAVGAAFGFVFLASERDDAVAAVAGGNVDFGFVDEFHEDFLAYKRKSPIATIGL